MRKSGILKNDGMPNCGARRRQSQGWWQQQQQQQQQQPRQYDVTDDDNLPELSISSASPQECSTRPLVQTGDYRNDTDDGGGRQCDSTVVEKDNNL